MSDIISITSEWDALLAQASCNRAYHCSTWYLATQELVPTLQPLVFVAYRNDILSGIFPLWLEPGRRLARFGDSYSDHLDVIAVDGDVDVVEGLVDLALQGTGSYDCLVLGPVRYDSNFVRGAKGLGLRKEVDDFFVPGKSLTYAVLDLRSGYDEYIKTLSRAFRDSLRRSWKRAERDGLTVRELTPAELKPELLPETFLSLHMSRFGDRSDLKSAEAWLRKLWPTLFAEGRIRVFAIFHKGRIVGIDVETVTGSGMYGCLGGFVPESRRYAPGKLLIHHVLQQAFLEGMTEYDFGWWEQGYKADWKPTKREVGDIRLATYPRSSTGIHNAEYSRT